MRVYPNRVRYKKAAKLCCRINFQLEHPSLSFFRPDADEDVELVHTNKRYTHHKDCHQAIHEEA